VAKLTETYPDARCELVHDSPFQLLIATILSAQCSDKQVNLVTENLFQQFPTPKAFASAPIGEIEKAIQRLGLFRNKAKNIQSACCDLVEKHSSQVPASMDALTELAGVGRKTANVVLGNAFKINAGVVVDTHVARLSKRLSLSAADSPEKIEADLARLIPQSQWTLLSHLLIWHGRRRCSARNPDCPHCEIQNLCPHIQNQPETQVAQARN